MPEVPPNYLSPRYREGESKPYRDSYITTRQYCSLPHWQQMIVDRALDRLEQKKAPNSQEKGALS